MKKTFISVLLFAVALCGSIQAQQLAFPGAEGFGRFAQGARGGGVTPTVYHVTNLNDSGTGSFRDAISQPNRIVVFDVSGVIKIKSRLIFSKNLTIAGQTAPGEGVTVYGNGVSFSSCDNIVVRYMRFRMGSKGDGGKDAAGIANGKNMIFDHVSIAWGLDENFSISWDNKGTEPTNITIQNSIIGQGIMVHACGGLIQTKGGVTLYRNLYIDNKTRNPKVKGLNQFVNNVVYNWGSGGAYILGDTQGSSWGVITDNYFVRGPEGGTQAFTRATTAFQVYQKGNMIDYNKDGALNGVAAVENDFRRDASDPSSENVTFVESYDTFKDIPQKHPEITTVMAAKDAYDWIVKNAGASLPARDEVDKYMVDELTSLGTKGALINSESELGLYNGVGNIFSGDKLKDSDGDGMPDVWEDANGLDKNNKADALVLASNGYLNIENYINSISEPMPFVRYPTALQISKIGETSITLKWNNNEENADKIVLEVSADNKTFTEKATLATTVDTYTVEGLEIGVKYYFRIKVVRGEISSCSDSVRGIIVNDDTPPFASENPTPENGDLIKDYKVVNLKWQNLTENWILTYDVYAGESADDLKVVASKIKVTTCPLLLKERTTYYWKVLANYTDDDGKTNSISSDVWSFTSGDRIIRDTLAYYSFDETTGNEIENKVTKEKLAAKNFSPIWVEGKVSNAITFSGEAGSGFTQTHYDKLSLDEKSFSISLWFKSVGGSVDWYLFHKGSHATTSYDGATGRWFGLQYNQKDKNDRLTWAVDDNVTKTDLDVKPGSTYFDNKWHHVACVRDLESGQLKVYIDGELKGSKADATGNIDSEEDMAIGNCNTAYENAFKGLMDEFVIFDGALTPEEVKDIYTGEVSEINNVTRDNNYGVAYPNPFRNQFTVKMDAAANENAFVELYNISGQMVYAAELPVLNGGLQLNGLESLASGIYTCVVKSETQIVTVKVSKMK